MFRWNFDGPRDHCNSFGIKKGSNTLWLKSCWWVLVLLHLSGGTILQWSISGPQVAFPDYQSSLGSHPRNTCRSSAFLHPLPCRDSLDAEGKRRLQATLLKLQRSELLPRDFPTFDELSELCQLNDQTLFQAVLNNENHVLYHLLPQ